MLLDDGTRIRMSRRYRAHVERVLGLCLGSWPRRPVGAAQELGRMKKVEFAELLEKTPRLAKDGGSQLTWTGFGCGDAS